MKLNSEEINEWVNAYIETQESDETIHEYHPLFWAIERFMKLNSDHPEVCWNMILEILIKKPSNNVLSILAAGPLEDLIVSHGCEYINKIENEARINPAFKYLLGGVWKSSTPEVWSRLQNIRGKPW